MSDTASIASSRRDYNLSERALEQRKLNGQRRRWFSDLKELNNKLLLKLDDSRLIREIASHLITVFTFADMVEIYGAEAYDDVYNRDDRTIQAREEIKQLQLKMHVMERACDKMKTLWDEELSKGMQDIQEIKRDWDELPKCIRAKVQAASSKI